MSNVRVRFTRPPVFVGAPEPLEPPAPRIAEGSIVKRLAPVMAAFDDVELTQPLEHLRGDLLSPAEAFLLSRLSTGMMSVDALANSCPFGRDKAMAMIRRHLCETGLLRIARPRRPVSRPAPRAR